jgi:hypothetical protein
MSESMDASMIGLLMLFSPLPAILFLNYFDFLVLTLVINLQTSWISTLT